MYSWVQKVMVMWQSHFDATSPIPIFPGLCCLFWTFEWCVTLIDPTPLCMCFLYHSICHFTFESLSTNFLIIFCVCQFSQLLHLEIMVNLCLKKIHIQITAGPCHGQKNFLFYYCFREKITATLVHKLAQEVYAQTLWFCIYAHYFRKDFKSSISLLISP